MCICQISIQRQRSLAFSYTLSRTGRKNMHNAQIHLSLRVLWVHGQSLNQTGLGCREGHGPVVGRKVSAPVKVNYRGANEGIDISGIED